MWVTSHTGKGTNPKLLGTIPMAGTKQITLRGAAHSKLREVMPKRRESQGGGSELWSALKGMHDRGMACNRIKTKLSSGAPSIHKFSLTLAMCLFWSVRRRKLQKAQGKLPEWPNGFHNSRTWATAARLICAGSLLLLFKIGSFEKEIVSFRGSGLEPRLPSLLPILRPVTYPLCAYNVYPWQITCMIDIRRQNASAPGRALLIRTCSFVRGSCEQESSAAHFSLWDSLTA